MDEKKRLEIIEERIKKHIEELKNINNTWTSGSVIIILKDIIK